MKHALPAIEPDLPRPSWPLSVRGAASCVALAERLRRYAPAAVYASREPKAAQTARLVALHLGLEHAVRDGLEEQDDAGEAFVGEPEFAREVSRLFATPERVVFGRESADAAYVRFARAIDALPTPAEGSAIVVAHGRVISLFVARRNAIDAFALWERLGLPSFVVLAYPELRIEEVVGAL